jgi:hypothetical protein
VGKVGDGLGYSVFQYFDVVFGEIEDELAAAVADGEGQID